MSQFEKLTSKKPKRRKSVASLSVKKLYQEAENRCPFCGVSDLAVLEIHHIDGDSANNNMDNLIVVCGNCHSKITRCEIAQVDVQAKKMKLYWMHKTSQQQLERKPVQSVRVNAVSVNDSIIANTVNIRSKRTPRIQHPVDSIGADVIKKGYIDYLIKRYYDFRQADASYGNFRAFSHAEIHTTIQRKFKAKTFFIHVSRFEELCDYIKSRVHQTIQGRRNRSCGIPNYDSFESYKTEQLPHAH